MTEAIVFDLDGTLIDSMVDIVASVNRMRESFGLATLPVPEVAAMTGNGAVMLTTRALQGTGCDVEEGVKRMKDFYNAYPVVETTLYPGVKEGLEQLFLAGIPMAVVTNKPTEPALKILSTLGVSRYFKHIWGGDSGFPLKPDPAALLAFQKECGAKQENCWMVGDHYTDLGAGRQAGFKRAFCTWGYGEVRDESFDREFASFSEFTAAVSGSSDRDFKSQAEYSVPVME
jgi:phosphoglycolate phosphatase